MAGMPQMFALDAGGLTAAAADGGNGQPVPAPTPTEAPAVPVELQTDELTTVEHVTPQEAVANAQRAAHQLEQASANATIQELVGMVKTMINAYETRLTTIQSSLDKKTKEMEEVIKKMDRQQQDRRGSDTDEKGLGPMNVKDVKLPQEYGGKAEEFQEWHQ